MKVEHNFPAEAFAVQRRRDLGDWIRKRRWFLLFVALPTLLAGIYYAFIVSDIYVSESRFVIKSPDQKRPQLSSLANLIQTTGLSSGQEETNEILEYVRSRDALRALDKHLDVRARFRAGDADPLSRFPQPFMKDSFEDLYKYYGKRVTAELDKETGTAIVKVEAFIPQDAYAINRELLGLSEALVNKLNDRAQNRAISEAQTQVELATDRARKARIAMAGYRNSKEIIDPAKQATGVIQISDEMVSQRAALQAQLDLMQRMTPRNPSIPAIRNRINAISVQIALQDRRVVGGDGGIASKLGGYENLLVEQEFATQNMTVANAALVQARADAQKQKFYLERIVDPDQPDEPRLPRRLLSVLVVAAVSLCIYFIGWMLIVGILEHAPEE